MLAALEAELRARYGGDYAVVGVESGAAALALLRVVHERRRPVALVIADQRMPAMTGAALLRHAREIAPHAKRVLLVAFGQTDSAIEAINAARIDHFLIKPWHPAAEHLYPALDELLEDWRATYRHGPDELRVVGHRWSPGTHDLKDFLARNQVPYRWQDLDSDAEARSLVAARPGAPLPWLVFPDGTALEDPDPATVAERLGLATEPARQL